MENIFHCNRQFYSCVLTWPGLGLEATLAKTVLFYFYFMAILILSHLFLYYFILPKLYFISILPDKENRASILFEFYFYFNPILKQD